MAPALSVMVSHFWQVRIAAARPDRASGRTNASPSGKKSRVSSHRAALLPWFSDLFDRGLRPAFDFPIDLFSRSALACELLSKFGLKLGTTQY
jgi:hypothetical protein